MKIKPVHAAILLLSSLIASSTALAAGALAIDENQGDQWGFAYDHPSISAASDYALEECGAGCEVVKTFSSGCAAYAADQASGSTAYGWATADDGATAQSEALSNCRSFGGNDCIVRSWGCNSD